MNIEYIYSDGHFIVGGDQGLKIVDYNDNIEDILQTENIIEQIEDRLKYISDKQEEKKLMLKMEKTRHKVMLLPLVLSVCIIFIIFFSQGNISDLSIFAKLGLSSVVACIDGFLISTVAACYNVQKSDLEGYNYEYNFLNNELIKYKEKLQSLRANKSQVFENVYKLDNNKGYNVEKSIEQVCLDKVADLNYDIGSKQRKYCKYLQNGKLEEILKEIYSEANYLEPVVAEKANEQISQAEMYFEKQGYQLTKKYKK